jgi:SAM-dependent methyltransferase
MSKNIFYRTSAIADYYASYRIKWDEFYKSEKKVIADLQLSGEERILDIGCGCGGLGLALKEKFGIESYTGIEINEIAARKARELNPLATIFIGDFLEFSDSLISMCNYDVVFSLSCLDWNIEFEKMLLAAWEHVAPGGSLIATFRIVAGQGINDINASYQYINYEGGLSGETAPYIVLNAKDLLTKLGSLSPSSIHAYGYFGTPSASSVTPFETICFTAVSAKKRLLDDSGSTKLHLNLPSEILLHLEH